MHPELSQGETVPWGGDGVGHPVGDTMWGRDQDRKSVV